ncbi:reverse transcriptase domain-containing protein, partial [Tanacetum coccineum]
FDGNTVFVPYDAPNFEEAKSSTTPIDPLNMYEFYQVQPSTHIWTKAHPVEQVIGDPSKPVMTQNRLQTDFELHLVGQNAVQNQGTQNVENQNRLSVVLRITNQHGNGNVVATWAEGNSNEITKNQIRCYNCRGEGHYASNCRVKPRKIDAAYLQTQLPIAQKDEAEIQLNYEEFDFMAAAGAYDEIEKVTANCNLQDNLQQASTSEEQYTELLELIPEPHQVQQNDSNVISAISNVEQSGGTVNNIL